ncbi:MAG: ATP-dependent zinc protease [Planctomycetales bacterium]|nr:ATP-dependent zinc protease [Planctomycetales bacterium]
MANSSSSPVPPGRVFELASLRGVAPRFLAAAVLAVIAGAVVLQLRPATGARTKRVLGPTELVEHVDAEALPFEARVDTGATTCSVHAAKWAIEDEADSMIDNVGKVIRFCVENGQGGAEWLERKIVELATVTTSEGEEQRYKVFMTLRCQGVEKRVLVSLNDRSHMQYPLLIGRNFLEGDFLVDVGDYDPVQHVR